MLRRENTACPVPRQPPCQSCSSTTIKGVCSIHSGLERNTSISLPWVAWMVEGYDGRDFLLTMMVPVRFAGKLRSAGSWMNYSACSEAEAGPSWLTSSNPARSRWTMSARRRELS